MDKDYYPDCQSKKTSLHHDYNIHSCTRNCSHKCSPHKGCHDIRYCCCHNSCCRKDLCDTDFSIRLGGLQDGLNYRLRQLLWCEAEFDLDAGNTVKGRIVSVGSNFVEVLLDETLQLESGDRVEDHISDDDMDKELTEKHPEEENELDEEYEERKHEIGKSWIFSIDKIANIKVTSFCHGQCTCY